MKAFTVLLIWAVLLCSVFLLIEARSKSQRRASASHYNRFMKRKFEGPEHRLVSNFKGYMALRDGTRRSTEDTHFINSKGVDLYTFGDIVAMAGDYYGPTSIREVICTSGDFPAQEALFLKFWRQMWDETSQKTIDTYKTLFDEHEEAFHKRSKGVSGAQVSAELGELRYVIAGGATFIKLSLSNLDHFGECAVETYKVGHLAAIRHAKRAALLKGGNLANAMVMEAYSMEAFAQHFLTDLFSAGHIRTPRKSLLKVCESQMMGLHNAGLLAQWMHDEDNRNGLWVKNQLGDTWKAYGDSSLLEDYAQEHFAMVAKATQIGRDEIYKASYDARWKPSFGALKVVPSLVLNEKSTCALFRQTLSGEVEVRDPWDRAGPFPCRYRPAVPEDCPSALGQKLKALFNLAVELKQDPKQKVWYVPSSTVEKNDPGEVMVDG